VGFDLDFVDIELWREFARDVKKMRRHAQACLRIEAIVISPTYKDCQKMSRRGGVYVQVRCTVCGELFTVMTEIDREDVTTKTGFKIRGQHVGGPDGKPIWFVTLADLLEATEFVNSRGEKGGQLMELFIPHAFWQEAQGRIRQEMQTP
jgi:hypothetical protein